jgi:hypothetical protein
MDRYINRHTKVDYDKWAKPDKNFFLERASNLNPDLYQDHGLKKVINDTKELNLKLADIFSK